MCDSPTVHRESAVRSRAPRRCDECFSTIAPGELHEYVFGVWDSTPDTFRTCAPCLETRNDLRELMEEGGVMYPEEIYCAVAYGSLRESLRDWCHECNL